MVQLVRMASRSFALSPVTGSLSLSDPPLFSISRWEPLKTGSRKSISGLCCDTAQTTKHPRSWEPRTQKLKVPSGENTELKRSPFKAWSRSIYIHTCYASFQGFLPCLFLPFRSIHLHFSKTSPDFFLCWLWLTLVPV